MLEPVVSLIIDAYQQLSANSDVILRSVGIGVSILSAFYTLLHFWRRSDINLPRRAEELAQELEEVIKRRESVRPPIEQPPPTQARKKPKKALPSDPHEQLVQAVENAVRREGQRSFWWGIAQGFVWYVLGIVTPILIQPFLR